MTNTYILIGPAKKWISGGTTSSHVGTGVSDIMLLCKSPFSKFSNVNLCGIWNKLLLLEEAMTQVNSSFTLCGESSTHSSSSSFTLNTNCCCFCQCCLVLLHNKSCSSLIHEHPFETMQIISCCSVSTQVTKISKLLFCFDHNPSGESNGYCCLVIDYHKEEDD